MAVLPQPRDDLEPSESGLGLSNEDETQVSVPSGPGGSEERRRRKAKRDEASLRASDEAVEAGTRIGRYMVLDAIGSGGVGVVFAVYDPDLDRKVALKQLRRSKLEGQAEAVKQRQVRLRREAQALARLSHPNVVPVYEVATYDEQIYVVMEFVEGESLGSWLAKQTRSWSEILAMFVQAGQGLAAAHAADIVHRDFKPDNVRVGHDGRARVLDFGLAAPLREGELEHDGESLSDLLERSFESESSWSGPRETEVTREGQVMGTPAYMPPEQATGSGVDARSDQFSFCVALYEALYGRRPFSGRFDDPRRFRDLSRSRTLPGKRPADLPTEVEEALIRGLSLVPEQRFESMDDLLAKLSVAETSERRLWWIPALLVFTALLVANLYAERKSAEASTCSDGQERLAGVWDASVAEQLRAAASSWGGDYATSVWDRSEERFEGWARAWSKARVRACEATREGEQTPALLERRMACLDRQLMQVEGILLGLRHHEGESREFLERVETLELPAPENCAGAVLLEHAALDPVEEAAAREGRELRAALAEVEGLAQAGDFTEAREHGEALLERVDALAFPPIQAEAKLLLGLAMVREDQDRARALELMREAAWIAQSVGHHAVLIRAAASLAMLTATEEAELEAAKLWADLARASSERHGEDPSIASEVHRHLGEYAFAAGDYDQALTEYQAALDQAHARTGERSLAYINALRSIGETQTELGQLEAAASSLEQARQLASAVLGTRHPVIPEILDSLGSAEMAQGKFERALELHRAALELTEELHGGEHPRVAVTLNNLAIIYDETGRYGEAVKTLERARAILVAEFGAEHPKVAYVDVNLGSALQNSARNSEALTTYEGALAVLVESLGPEHMAVGVTLQNLGSVRAALDDYGGALADYDRAASVLVASFGETHPSLVSLEKNRASALRKLGRDDEALTAARRALTMTEAIWGPDHGEQLVSILTTLATIESELGNQPRALDHAERAVRLCSPANPPTEVASAHLELAELVERELGDRARAREHAEEALRMLERAEGSSKSIAEAQAWLDAHPSP